MSALTVKPFRRPPPPVPGMTDVDTPPQLPPRRSRAMKLNHVSKTAFAPTSTTEKLSTVGNLRSMFESPSPSPREDLYKDQLRKQAKRLSEQQNLSPQSPGNGRPVNQSESNKQSPTLIRRNIDDNRVQSPMMSPATQSQPLPSPLRMHLSHSRPQVSVSHSYLTAAPLPQDATLPESQNSRDVRYNRGGDDYVKNSHDVDDQITSHDRKSSLTSHSSLYNITKNTNLENDKLFRHREPAAPIDIVAKSTTSRRRSKGNDSDLNLNDLPLPSPPDPFDVAVDNEDNFPLSPSELPPPPPELLTTFTEEDDDDMDKRYPSESYGSYKNSRVTRQCGVYRRSSSAADVERNRLTAIEYDEQKRRYERRISEGSNVLQSESRYMQEQSRLAGAKIQDGRLQDGQQLQSQHQIGRNQNVRYSDEQNVNNRRDQNLYSRNENSEFSNNVFHRDSRMLNGDMRENRRSLGDFATYEEKFIDHSDTSKHRNLHSDKRSSRLNKMPSEDRLKFNNGIISDDGLPPKVPHNDKLFYSNHTPSKSDSYSDKINVFEAKHDSYQNGGKANVFEAKRIAVLTDADDSGSEDSPRSVRDLRQSYESLTRSCEDLTALSPRQMSPRHSLGNVLEDNSHTLVKTTSLSCNYNNDDFKPIEISHNRPDRSDVQTGRNNESSSDRRNYRSDVQTGRNNDSSSDRPITNHVTAESIKPVTNQDCQSNKSAETCVSDSPTQQIVISHRRQKSFEELECEKRAKLLANRLKEEDSKLSRVISPAPEKKDAMHYMNGLYENNNNKGENSIETSPQARRDLINAEKSPLPSTSPYWMSPGKAMMETSLRDTSNSEILKDISDDKEILVLKKGELVCSIEKKLEVLREEKVSLQQEIQENNDLGQQIAMAVEERCLDNERSKFKTYTDDLDKIVRLLLKLSGLLARTENAINSLSKDADDRQKRALNDKRERLSDQHDEAKRLKCDIDKRSIPVAAILKNNLGDEMLENFSLFVDSKSKFTIEMQELDDKLALGEEQMSALKRSMEDSE